MKKIITSLSSLLCCLLAAALDNVTVTNHCVTYTLVADKGELKNVKSHEEITFLTPEKSATALAVTSYSDKVKVIKASAPGATPQYRQDIDDGIFYDDSRLCVLAVPLKGMKEATAVFDVRIDDPAVFGRHTFSTIYDTKVYEASVVIPPELADRFSLSTFNLPPDAVTDTDTDKKGNVVYRIILKNVKPAKASDYRPGRWSTPQFVVKGQFRDISGLYTHLHRYAPNGDTPAIVADKASEIVAGADDAVSKIDSIAAWVRNNIRYIAIEHGDYGYSPASASEVLENRYGDCKGSANLIKHMLCSQGIDGRLAWVGTSDHSRLNWKDYPLATLGNHMIAVAMLPDTIVFIDGTIRLAPDGEIPPSIQGQWTIIEDGDNPIVCRVPMADGIGGEDYSVIYNFDGQTLSGHAKRSFSGSICRYIDETYQSLPVSRRLNSHLMAGTSNSPNLIVNDYSFSRSGQSSQSLTIEYDFTDKANVKQAAGYSYLNICPLDTRFIEKVDTLGRYCGMKMSMCHDISASSVLYLPNDCNITVPEPVSITNPWFEALISYTTDSNAVECHSSLKILRKEANIQELPDWNKAVECLEKACRKNIKITSNTPSE